jgi:seryl-tRNA(Sec) selenium transferase
MLAEESVVPNTAQRSELPHPRSELPQLTGKPTIQVQNTTLEQYNNAQEQETKTKSSMMRKTTKAASKQQQHHQSQSKQPKFKVKVALKGKIDSEVKVQTQVLRSPISSQREPVHDMVQRPMKLNVLM